MAEGFHTVDDQETLKTVLRLAQEDKATPKEKDGSLNTSFTQLVEQLVKFATGEDSYWDEPRNLLDRAVHAWKATAIRKPGEPAISLTIQEGDDWRSRRLVLDIAADDKPFIVDSLSSALTEAGKPVSFFVNAVIDGARDKNGKRTQSGVAVRESMIHAEMDPPVDDAEIDALESELRLALADVSLSVDDWEPMRARLGACIAQLERTRPAGVDADDLRQTIDFLKWLWDNRFAFLGARRYAYSTKSGKTTFTHDKTADLGIARDQEKRILKTTYTEDGEITPAVLDFMESGEPILVAKANVRSRVHRRAPMDYIGVKTYAIDGSVTGEERFIGLFTADAYYQPASQIPLLQAKVRRVIEGAAFSHGGHNEKALLNILETFPRDEMFQSDVDSLRETALGVLRLYKRPRTKLFLRRDRFDRFVSALVFIPRDSFSSSVREEIGDVLSETFNGRVASFNPHFGDAALVRVHFIIAITPGAPEGPGLTQLTRQLRAITRSWSGELLDEMRSSHDGAAPAALFNKYENAFSAGYREHTPVATALLDIEEIEKMGDKRRAERVYREPGAPAYTLKIKLYCRGGPLALSTLIPQIENLGLGVIQEAGYDVKVAPGEPGSSVWIHDFYTEQRNKRDIDVDAVRANLETALDSVLAGTVENDGFNALVVSAGLTCREAWLMRSAAKYNMQTGFAASQRSIEEALVNNPDVAYALAQLFHARFNPAGPANLDARAKEVDACEARILSLLENVQRLDEDRVVRRFVNFFKAVTRTNYYQTTPDGGSKACLAFKIDSQQLTEIPDPKPFREIFVSGPRVDGVHLRFGPIARGGLRWSDRRDDFRTEVLGLVKAQRVKNAVIVPTGSKGGFFPKNLPVDGDRAAIFEEGRGAYQEFIRSLLDVTDNIVDGKTTPPPAVVRWDEDDPYLVVAADKGTATFSDTANALAAEYSFWLGDAFASGGSAGYDHKVMGITARGAWEAVKRHFREMGKDIQEEPFTTAGVGDMSGDVFGNGMLLSKQTCLIAAFDHRDIFIDPNPDPARSWEERKRLFDLPRSSWQDYDKSLISSGGGVFSRSAKSIPLSGEMQSLLEIDAKSATPTDIMKGILKAQTELFWLGGIGTYFKATSEENWRVGDRANDALRINAEEMRMAVIGEGANLGLTQKARMAFADLGGRVNTDAIDNSAGVDSSDHEVNIKILLSTAIEKGELKQEDRNALLEDMTDDVADHVLQHNYDQTRGLSVMQDSAVEDLNAYARLMSRLESNGRLDRAIEDLPNEKQLEKLQQQGRSLSRPELSVLLAYAKLHLFDEIVVTDAPDDPSLEAELFAYFPSKAQKFNHSLVQHRLRREIIATRLANEIIDTCGAAFPMRVVEATGAGYADMALAYEAARRIMNVRDFAASVDALDNKISAQVQTKLYRAASKLIGEQVYRLLSDATASQTLSKRGVKGLLSSYETSITTLKKAVPDVLSPDASDSLSARIAGWEDAGAPTEISKEAALMPFLEFALDIVNLAASIKWDTPIVAALFFEIGERYNLASTRDAARGTVFDDHFDRLASRRLTEEISVYQAQLTYNAASFAEKAPSDASRATIVKLIDDWSATHEMAIAQTQRYASELRLSGGVTIGRLSLFTKKVGELAERTSRQ